MDIHKAQDETDDKLARPRIQKALEDFFVGSKPKDEPKKVEVSDYESILEHNERVYAAVVEHKRKRGYP